MLFRSDGSLRPLRRRMGEARLGDISLPLPARQPQRCLPGSRHLGKKGKAVGFWRRRLCCLGHAPHTSSIGVAAKLLTRDQARRIAARSYYAELRAALPLLGRAD
jgi:hypothetical protein